MIAMSAPKPLPPGTIERPVGTTSDLSIGHVEPGDPIVFQGRLYKLVRYAKLGGRIVWSPIAQLERVERADRLHRSAPPDISPAR